MAKKKTIIVDAQGKNIKGVAKDVQKTRQETEKLDKSRKKLNKTTDRYNRREKGAAQMGMNSTKSFSKMSQSIGDEGGGGAGGLVRAYALLAANVFALSAAFGILSRSAQVDTLIESMERLEVVTGNAVKSMARELQQAAAGGLDFAEAMRSTSLALSAGFDSSTIKELGEVAKNAAVSLGRPIADSLDRIFRGVIKVEPELLDEIGLFVRVKEASARYASTLGMAASELTEFQKRQAFATESVRQGQEKFAEFSDIDIDAFALLAASFSDLAHEALSFINRGLGPIIVMLAENKELLGAAFAAISIALLRKAIPAMGLFTRSIADQATTASAAHAKYVNEIKSKAQLEKEQLMEKIALQRTAQNEAIAGAQAARRLQDTERSFKGGKKLTQAKLDVKESVSGQQRINALKQKQVALNASMRDSTRQAIMEEQAALEREIQMEIELLNIKKQQKTVTDTEIATGGKNKLAQLITARLARKEILAVGMASVAATAETHGFWAALKQIRVELKLMGVAATEAGVKLGWFSKTLFVARGAVVSLTTAVTALMTRLMGFLGILLLALPVVVWFLKKLGFWSKEAKILAESTKKLNDLMETWNAKMSHAANIMNQINPATTKLQGAQLAMGRTIRDTSAAIIQQMEDLEQFKRTATDVVMDVHNLQTDYGFGSEQQGIDAQREFLGGLIDTYEIQSKARKDLLGNEGSMKRAVILQDRWNKSIDKAREAEEKLADVRDIGARANNMWGAFSRGWKIADALQARAEHQTEINRLELIANGLREDATKQGEIYNVQRDGLINRLKRIKNIWKDINKLSSREATGEENMISIQDGAKENLRSYLDQFLVKTDIDKPLTTFTQATANILADTEEMVVNEQARDAFLNGILDKNSAIFGLMSRENQKLYEITDRMEKWDGQEEARIEILKKQRMEYERQQKILIQNKTTIESMAKVQKMMAKLVKEDATFFTMNLAMDKKKLEFAKEEAEIHHENFLSAQGFTAEEFRQNMTLEKRDAFMTKWLDKGNDRKELLSAENQLNKIKIMELQQEIDGKTEIHKIAKATAEIELKRITAQEKLNQALLQSQKINRQIASLGRRGTTSLSGKESIEQIIEEENVRRETADKKAKQEKAVIKAQFAILKAEAEILAKRAELYEMESFSINTIVNDLSEAANVLVETIDQGLKNAADEFAVKLGGALVGLNLTEGLDKQGGDRLDRQLEGIKGGGLIMAEAASKANLLNKEMSSLKKTREESFPGGRPTGEAEGSYDGITERINDLEESIEKLDAVQFAAKMQLIINSFIQFAEQVKELGPEGNVAANMAMFSANLVNFASVYKNTWNETADTAEQKAGNVAVALQGVSTVIQGFASVLAADAQAKISIVDDQIAAEKKLDGKSAESLAKIKAMEQKKEAIKRKQFEVNKKLQIANAIISTASGAAQAYAMGGPLAIPLAAMIVALGMAQVAMIKKTSYQGGGSIEAAKNTELNIGKRNSTVDVSRGASGGELSYLRGERGIGQANNFTPTGGAAGLRKGYNTGGVLVGEQGPEVIQARGGYEVIPNDRLGGGNANVNFTINAVDAAGVEDVLLRQRGNIIGMIRSAANDAGEGFLETVDTDVVGYK